VWKAYGDNNRTCVVRTVAGRLEWRLPDPSCNVYAAIAATLAAGLNGIDQAMAAPAACNEDLYARMAMGAAMPQRLPRDLACAIEALAADEPLRGALGQAFCEEFLQLKRREWDEFHASISDWEFQRYASLF
jgi:glutamine synthetase